MVFDTELALEAWAGCVRGGLHGALGYPSMSLEHRSVFGKGAGSTPGGSEWPQEALKVERACLAMPEHLFAALRLSYVLRFTVRDSAKQVGCAMSTFSGRLESARAFVAGYLSQG